MKTTDRRSLSAKTLEHLRLTQEKRLRLEALRPIAPARLQEQLQCWHKFLTETLDYLLDGGNASTNERLICEMKRCNLFMEFVRFLHEVKVSDEVWRKIVSSE